MCRREPAGGLGAAYNQDDLPVREARVLRGHAVRALYLASGAVDVAVETGDSGLLEAVAEQWRNTVAARAYLTGGMGSRHTGESFGDDFELPPDRAYAETCAGVAAVMLCWRLLLATGEAGYADAIERILFNVVATSPALDGHSFFYANPLQQRSAAAPADGDAESPHAAGGQRSRWFSVSCCPTNLARTLTSLAAYIATADDHGVQLQQLTACTVRTTLPLDQAGPEDRRGARLRRRRAGPAGLLRRVGRPGSSRAARRHRGRHVNPAGRPRPRQRPRRRRAATLLRQPRRGARARLAYAADPDGKPATPIPLTLIPYYAWANRGPSAMRVWLPEQR
jgi:DUF1680 family protein